MANLKELYLVRHATSSWELNLVARERPLSERGESDAHNISKYIKDKNYLPNIILISPALRTHTTCNIFVKNLNLKEIPIKIIEDLYDFSGENLTRTLIKAFENYDKVMIFGHNEAVTNFANRYSNARIDNIPTCGFCYITFKITEKNSLEKGILKDFVYPNLLR